MARSIKRIYSLIFVDGDTYASSSGTIQKSIKAGSTVAFNSIEISNNKVSENNLGSHVSFSMNKYLTQESNKGTIKISNPPKILLNQLEIADNMIVFVSLGFASPAGDVDLVEHLSLVGVFSITNHAYDREKTTGDWLLVLNIDDDIYMKVANSTLSVHNYSFPKNTRFIDMLTLVVKNMNSVMSYEFLEYLGESANVLCTKPIYNFTKPNLVVLDRLLQLLSKLAGRVLRFCFDSGVVIPPYDYFGGAKEVINIVYLSKNIGLLSDGLKPVYPKVLKSKLYPNKSRDTDYNHKDKFFKEYAKRCFYFKAIYIPYLKCGMYVYWKTKYYRIYLVEYNWDSQERANISRVECALPDSRGMAILSNIIKTS